MPVEWPMRVLQLRYKGILDVQELQRVMIQWFKARRYWFQETSHKHMSGNEFGREEEIYWTAERLIDNYVKFEIEIYFHLWDIEQVEIIQEGKKKNLIKARIEIWFRGFVKFDYQGHWEKTRFHIALRSFYHKYILTPEGIMASLYWDELYYRIYKLRDLVKDYLNLKTKGFEYRRYIADNIP